MKSSEITVADYLITRLKEIGVDHLFGVPGDFVLGFFNQVLKSDLKYVGTCNELNAAYAADGYARIRGVGAFSSTYGVGELSAINGVAGAFAERVPMVVITGSPSTINFRTRPLLHHTLGDYQIPLRIYEKITAASTELVSAETAPAEIDRVLSVCLSHQQPVYISIPSDVVMMSCQRPQAFLFPPALGSDPDALGEAITEALEMLDKAQKPIVIGDVELIRFKLQQDFAGFLDKTGFPYVTMMLGKSVLSEQHPQFIGLFEGERSREYVRNRVESADCILQLGAVLTDFNTGGFTTNLDDAKTISANIRSVRIKHHYYENVSLHDFILGLTEKLTRRDPATLDIQCAADGCVHRRAELYQPDVPKLLTIKRFFDRMSHFIEDDAIVIAETGVSLFSAAEMLMPEGVTFIGQTFYGSIGYTIGATLGAGMAAQDRQVVLFVGDGSFQVTGQDLSTMIRNHLKPVIFLINNDGYTIERVISDHPYNDLQPWKYHKLVEVFGGGLGLDVRTEGELEEALTKAATADDLVFIEIHTGRLDCPESLRSAGQSMAKTNQLE
ncbi:alpha-keto acid decarboxylase family protein [Methylobacter tundripaludum]|uniref:Pyruvate decarboxylase n=1 Tax=Methylobacter tundripaludum (strain ATCC BAA-1195 / DSM 17260 / SV96) TaxID=697282 RepID=G3IVK3_METTV|nr:thiamine pyrophosphate-binding protein [Methylobacter tundripaludum]EGW21740.1 Pyruvate decarboxylase [Methylobacter tundripaludum SV96]